MLKNVKFKCTSLLFVSFAFFHSQSYADSQNILNKMNQNINFLNINALQGKSLKEKNDLIPAPLTDLEGLKQYTKDHQGNLPNVYGKLDLNDISLNNAYISGGFKNFPIQLNCMQQPVCNTRLEIGDLGNGVFRIAAYDKNTKKSAELIIKFTQDGDGYVSTSNQAYTLEQPGTNEVINTDNYVDVNPYFSYNYNTPISLIELPLAPSSYYQICDGNGGNCSEKKQLFDDMFSGNKVEYLSFWKLEQKSYLSPDTSQSFQFSYTTGLTNTSSTTLSWSIGLKIPINGVDLSGAIGQEINKSVSFQNSRTVSHTVTFEKPSKQASIGEYVLYVGINDQFPVLDNLVNDLNSRLQNNSEFVFSKAQEYKDLKSNTGISSGSTAFLNSNSSDPNNLIPWPVSVPSY